MGLFDAIGSALGLISGVGPVVSAIGGMFTDTKNRAASEAQLVNAERYNDAEAAINRQWATDMSNTAYQRQVADMKAAGVNPMLSAMTGGGASTPGIGNASVSPVSLPPSQNRLGEAVSSAMDAQRTMATIDNMQAQTEKTWADAELSRSTKLNTDTNTALQVSQNITEQGRPGQMRLQNGLIQAQTAQNAASARSADASVEAYGAAAEGSRAGARASDASARYSNAQADDSRSRVAYRDKWGADVPTASRLAGGGYGFNIQGLTPSEMASRADALTGSPRAGYDPGPYTFQSGKGVPFKGVTLRPFGGADTYRPPYMR